MWKFVASSCPRISLNVVSSFWKATVLEADVFGADGPEAGPRVGDADALLALRVTLFGMKVQAWT